MCNRFTQLMNQIVIFVNPIQTFTYPKGRCTHFKHWCNEYFCHEKRKKEEDALNIRNIRGEQTERSVQLVLHSVLVRPKNKLVRRIQSRNLSIVSSIMYKRLFVNDIE